jgi:hypothetical protein
MSLGSHLTLAFAFGVVGWLLGRFVRVEVTLGGRPSTSTNGVEDRSHDVAMGTSTGGCSENGRVDPEPSVEKPRNKKQGKKRRKQKPKQPESWIGKQVRLGLAFVCRCGALTAPGDRRHVCERTPQVSALELRNFPDFGLQKAKKTRRRKRKRKRKSQAAVVEASVQAKPIWKLGTAQTEWSTMKPVSEMTHDEARRVALVIVDEFIRLGIQHPPQFQGGDDEPSRIICN